jgi:hypothetical protein
LSSVYISRVDPSVCTSIYSNILSSASTFTDVVESCFI